MVLVVDKIFINIKTHGSVLCGPRKKKPWAWDKQVCILQGVKKTPVSRICSSKLPEQKHTKFSVQISSGWGTSNSKFELNQPSRSRDMHLQSSSYFLLLFLLCNTFKITITRACFVGLP